MIAVTVRREPTGYIKSRMPACDHVENACSSHCAQHLSNDVREQILRREAAARTQADRNRRVQVPARHMTDGECHGEHRQAEGQRYPYKADAQSWEGGSQHRASTTP